MYLLQNTPRRQVSSSITLPWICVYHHRLTTIIPLSFECRCVAPTLNVRQENLRRVDLVAISSTKVAAHFWDALKL